MLKSFKFITASSLLTIALFSGTAHAVSILFGSGLIGDRKAAIEQVTSNAKAVFDRADSPSPLFKALKMQLEQRDNTLLTDHEAAEQLKDTKTVAALLSQAGADQQ